MSVRSGPALLALALCALAFGPVFSTRSKDHPDPELGLAGLARLTALARPSGLPLVAIGGITADNAAEVGSICSCAAVIGDLLPSTSRPPGDTSCYRAATARADAIRRALLREQP